MANRVLVRRVSARDKEYHFQNWFADRLTDAAVLYDLGRRNVYPGFPLVQVPEGYEVKGLAWPVREANYDANCQVPTGFHNGRRIYYVFGRYPAGTVESEYPVVDLVLCHGDFLNAHHEYVHKNKSIKAFGSWARSRLRAASAFPGIDLKR